MGNVSDNMKPTKDSAKGVFGNISGKWGGRRKADTKDAPRTFVDNVSEAHESLQKLVVSKEADHMHERGKETENARKLAILKTMQFHLEEIMDLAVEYNDGK